jgi:hypothetical protein
VEDDPDAASSGMGGAGYFSEERPLNANKWVRQIHRWLSIAFTVSVTSHSSPWHRSTHVCSPQRYPVGLLLLTGCTVCAAVTQCAAGDAPSQSRGTPWRASRTSVYRALGDSILRPPQALQMRRLMTGHVAAFYAA